ncbi:MAG: hypothetical protein HY231_09920 [Acidobacteria bacterium]|nr:hypothetical protein [Acidobacteriota bacterium]
MFEQPIGKVEKDRSRTIILASGLAVLLVIVLIVLASWFGTKGQKNIDLYAEGSAEFAAYAPNIQVEIKGQWKGERLNYYYRRMVCTVTNMGDKTISGLKLAGAAVMNTGETLDEYQVLKEKVVTPIPNLRDSLAPHQSMEVEINIEPLDQKTDNMVDRLITKVKGLKVQ